MTYCQDFQSVQTANTLNSQQQLRSSNFTKHNDNSDFAQRSGKADRPLVTIEFIPDIHPSETEYNYPHPKFVFGDEVINKFNPSTVLNICALELIEHKTPSGLLLEQPYWKYKVDNGSWYEESVLIRQSNTCAKCTYFEDYNDERGRGWCHLLDNATRKHHQRTNDCDLNSESKSILALPYSEYDYGDRVKIVDSDKDHSEWAVFEVIEKKHNPQCYSSVDNYLTQSEWYYLLSPAYEDMWVAERELCHADLSHTVVTEQLF
ncbi:hypothetical protein [Myxosarcina sp. GI1]|uniref:hypothetical protein n=1 Tax=Myxosarcina sp. GI1 TaxID=1541065 RepID=UPI00056B5F47|nr:hypothetical protein [Myxosarcina sp. GI1]